DRRKGFLAQGGVGTIDQALLAILPAKYQSLRVFGLQDKVLIVDEAHAFDAYVLKELATLIELHATLGGTTIIMSATLPLAARQKLAQAHQRGLGCREFARLAGRAYPMVTTVTSALHAHELPLDLAERSRRNVAVERIARVAEAEDMVVSLARNGAAVAMIRSTVDAAIESYERLCGHLGSERVELLHSRFLPEHRGRIETAILSRFGKASTPDMRQGRVVVATQVIEQSLDLDFDALVTDIAPIDLLIQRAGRLWRHTHRAARTVLAPVLHVISPSPTPEDAAGWLDATLKEASWVYRDTGRLWLTARRLFEAGEVILTNLGEDEPAPTHARRLVDAVYEGDQDLPTESLRQASARAEGIEEANKTIAVFATLNIGAGYVADSLKWEAEGSLATRLEEPKRVNVRLGVRRNGAIVPISEVPSWASSQISVTEFWARDLPVPDDEQKKSLQPAWSEADEGCRLLILTEVETGYCDAAANFLYSDNIGLLRRSPPTKK
ncbi:MAG: CRISPR-associated helicase Cas3', partial [Beijerinckiaceae bacterium]